MALPLTVSHISTQPLSPTVLVEEFFPLTTRKRLRSASVFPTTAVTEARLNGYCHETVHAVRTNDVARLRALYGDGLCMNACNRSGESLLHLACRRGTLETVAFFIHEAHVDVTVTDDLGRTCLHDVCWRPRASEAIPILKLLLHSVPPQLLIQADRRGHTCLNYTRKEDWGKWNAFLQEQSVVLRRRIQLVQKLEYDYDDEESSCC